MAQPIFVEGDTGPFLVYVKDAGVAVNLTGVTPLAKLTQPDGTVIDLTEAITNAAAGEITITFIATDLKYGKNTLQIKLTFADRIKYIRAIDLFVERKISGL